MHSQHFVTPGVKRMRSHTPTTTWVTALLGASTASKHPGTELGHSELEMTQPLSRPLRMTSSCSPISTAQQQAQPPMTPHPSHAHSPSGLQQSAASQTSGRRAPGKQTRCPSSVSSLLPTTIPQRCTQSGWYGISKGLSLEAGVLGSRPSRFSRASRAC